MTWFLKPYLCARASCVFINKGSHCGKVKKVSRLHRFPLISPGIVGGWEEGHHHGDHHRQLVACNSEHVGL